MTTACEQLNHCNHPAVKDCILCRIGLCSAHIVECVDCHRVFCRECRREHRCRRKPMERITMPELVDLVRGRMA
jgi:predicted sulfurtransferase